MGIYSEIITKNIKTPFYSALILIIVILTMDLSFYWSSGMYIRNTSIIEVINHIPKLNITTLILNIIALLLVYSFFLYWGEMINLLLQNIFYSIFKRKRNLKPDEHDLNSLINKLCDMNFNIQDTQSDTEKMLYIIVPTEAKRDLYIRYCIEAKEDNLKFMKNQSLSRLILILSLFDFLYLRSNSVVYLLFNNSSSFFYSTLGLSVFGIVFMFASHINSSKDDARSYFKLPRELISL